MKQRGLTSETLPVVRGRDADQIESPGGRVMELTTKLAGALQYDTLVSTLGPVQGYLSTNEAATSRDKDCVDTNQQMIEIIEKNDTRGCITC